MPFGAGGGNLQRFFGLTAAGMDIWDDRQDDTAARSLAARIRGAATRRWRLLEASGDLPRALVARQLVGLVAPAVDLTIRSGCPACLMPPVHLENARRLAAMPGLLFVAFHDVLAGSAGLCARHAAAFPGTGGQTVASPLDALDLALANADREVVFFAAGTEAAAAAHATVIRRARELGAANFSVLVSNTTAPMAISSLLDDAASAPSAPEGFVVARHLGGLLGWTDYESIAAAYRVPIVVTGFEPVDMLEGILLAVRQLEEGRHEVEHQDVGSARSDDAPPGQGLVTQVFQVEDRQHSIPGATGRSVRLSGLALRAAFAEYDAALRFGLARVPS